MVIETWQEWEERRGLTWRQWDERHGMTREQLDQKSGIKSWEQWDEEKRLERMARKSPNSKIKDADHSVGEPAPEHPSST